MAPDLNSVPPSPRPWPTAQSNGATSASPSSSRWGSQVMGPPPVPYSPASNGGDNTGVDSGPGPLRHPRPMTVAELHLELEKEQEAAVNRLTRELTLLRQQTASVASTASSTSTSLNDDSIHGSYYVSGVHPTSSRRHRSSSNLSSTFPAISGSTAGSVTGIAPSRDSGLPSSRPSGEYSRIGRSREPSIASPRQSGTSSPSLSSSLQQRGEHFPHSTTHSHRPSLGAGGAAEHHRSTSSSSVTARYEEAAYHRAELESLRRENEMLRRRVRELELTLKTLRERETQSANALTDAAATESSLVSGMRDASIGDSQ